MPRNVSDEEVQLRKRARRRLVGAVVLVAVVSALLPMVLDREPGKSRPEIAIQVPPREGAPPLQAPEPARPPAPEAPPGPAKPADAPPPQPPEPKPSPAADKPVKAADKPATAAAPEPKSDDRIVSAAPNGPRFVVQLGAFSDPANAKQLRDRLSAEGIKSYTEVLKSDRGEKLRVRAGPFPTREAADQANERLHKLGVKGIVAPL